MARLVRRLDGMPLAIERVEAVGVAQLLDRLDDRFAAGPAGTGAHGSSDPGRSKQKG